MSTPSERLTVPMYRQAVFVFGGSLMKDPKVVEDVNFQGEESVLFKNCFSTRERSILIIIIVKAVEYIIQYIIYIYIFVT